jgi:putative endonuclease
MFTIYILYSIKDRRLYVGCTTNVSKRVKRHNYGEVQATKSRRPLVLIHSEIFENKGEAFQRERFLKSLWGARAKKKILREWLDKDQMF